MVIRESLSFSAKWKTIQKDGPPNGGVYKAPYKSCLVYSSHPDAPHAGVQSVIRWDFEKGTWFSSDINSNWLVQEPYIITHYCDDIPNPFLFD